MNKIFTLLIVALFLASCASTGSTAYKPASDNKGYGYSETQLSEDRYRVNFSGNTVTDRETVKDMALLRAAELTLVNGYDWFQVIDRETEKVVNSKPKATTAVEQNHRVDRSCGLLGCTTTVSPVYSRIQVSSERETNKFFTSIEVIMGKGETSDKISTYNAMELRKYLTR